MARRAPLLLLALAALLIAARGAHAMRAHKNGVIVPAEVAIDPADAPPANEAPVAAHTGAPAAGAAAGAAVTYGFGMWIVENLVVNISGNSWIRRLSPGCPANISAAAACASYSGHSSAVSMAAWPELPPAATAGAATRCVCDWRNVAGVWLHDVRLRCMV